jgi:peptidoglycan/xylan/chitin deacetylase (PgdA/CDA1 family)
VRRLLAAACCLAAAASGCGEQADDALWAPGPPDRSRVPVLVYRGVAADDLERQLGLLDRAGYETIGLADLARFVAGEQVRLPPRPLVLTFDGGRADTAAAADPALREHGFRAALFVDAGRVEAGHPAFLGWNALDRLQRSGRWELQLQSGSGNHLIRYGPAPDDVGPFYAYRGSEEVLGGWRERVFSDITEGERQLAAHIHGHRPLAFAPPYGNYGQAGTNDRRIPRALLARLLLDYPLVFTQDRSGSATAGSKPPLGRIVVSPGTTDRELHDMLR